MTLNELYKQAYYKNKQGMIMLGDCLNIMRQMDDGCIDLTVTSPPYDNLRKYNGYCFDFENIAKELYRVTKDGGVVVWVVGDATIKGSETGTSFRQALYFMDCGFNLHDTMIYKKKNPIPQNHNRYEQCFEYMFVLSKGKPSTFNPIKEPTKTLENHSSGGIARQLWMILSAEETGAMMCEMYLKTNPNRTFGNILLVEARLGTRRFSPSSLPQTIFCRGAIPAMWYLTHLWAVEQPLRWRC